MTLTLARAFPGDSEANLLARLCDCTTTHVVVPQLSLLFLGGPKRKERKKYDDVPERTVYLGTNILVEYSCSVLYSILWVSGSNKTKTKCRSVLPIEHNPSVCDCYNQNTAGRRSGLNRCFILANRTGQYEKIKMAAMMEVSMLEGTNGPNQQVLRRPPWDPDHLGEPMHFAEHRVHCL